MASSISDCPRATEFRRRTVATSSTVRRCSSTCRQSPSEPTRHWQLHVLGCLVECWESQTPQKCGHCGRLRSRLDSTGTANQRTDQGYRRVYSEVNKQAPAKKRSEEEQLLENATTRLARLRVLATSGPPPASHTADLDVQVSELKAKLAVVEAERDARVKEAERSHHSGGYGHDSEGSQPQAHVAGKILFLIATRKC